MHTIGKIFYFPLKIWNLVEGIVLVIYLLIRFGPEETDRILDKKIEDLKEKIKEQEKEIKRYP